MLNFVLTLTQMCVCLVTTGVDECAVKGNSQQIWSLLNAQ